MTQKEFRSIMDQILDTDSLDVLHEGYRVYIFNNKWTIRESIATDGLIIVESIDLCKFYWVFRLNDINFIQLSNKSILILRFESKIVRLYSDGNYESI